MNRLYALLVCGMCSGAHAQLVDLDQATKPAIAPAPALKIDMTVAKPEWVGQKGSTLRQTLTAWAAKAQWDFIWDQRLEEWDYNLVAKVTFHGDIEEAFSSFVGLYEFADIPLVLQKNREQRLFIVGKKGDSK